MATTAACSTSRRSARRSRVSARHRWRTTAASTAASTARDSAATWMRRRHCKPRRPGCRGLLLRRRHSRKRRNETRRILKPFEVSHHRALPALERATHPARTLLGTGTLNSCGKFPARRCCPLSRMPPPPACGMLASVPPPCGMSLCVWLLSGMPPCACCCRPAFLWQCLCGHRAATRGGAIRGSSSSAIMDLASPRPMCVIARGA